MSSTRSGSSSELRAIGSARGARTWSPTTIAWLGAAAVLVLRLWLVHTVTFCGTPDSCSYLALAESLSRHHGFVENFLYQYQMVDVHLPQHGIEYWRPGTSFLFLLAQPLGGVTLHSSLLITVLASGLLAAAAWRIAIDAWGDRDVACVAFLFCLVLPPVWGSAITPDSSIFYGAAVAWCLALFRVPFRSYREDVLAWFCLAAVNMIRNDAVLLAVPIALVLWLRRKASNSGRGSSLRYCALAVVAFIVAMVPMALLSRAVLGQSGGSHITQSLYLTDLSELLNYGPPVSLHTALAHGIKKLVTIRVSTTLMIAYRFVFLMCGFGAVLLAGIARLQGERRLQTVRALAAPLAFWFAVVSVYGLALPAIGQFSALRSFTGVLPATAAAMAMGAATLCGNVRALRTLGWAAIVFSAVSGVMTARRGLETTNQDGVEDRTVAQYLHSHGADPAQGALVMTADAAQFAETTGFAAVPVPSNGTEATLAAVRDLHPTHMLLKLDPQSEYADNLIAALHPVEANHVPGTRLLVLTLAPAGVVR